MPGRPGHHCEIHGRYEVRVLRDDRVEIVTDHAVCLVDTLVGEMAPFPQVFFLPVKYKYIFNFFINILYIYTYKISFTA